MDSAAPPSPPLATGPAPRRQEVTWQETVWIRNLLGRVRGGNAVEAARDLVDNRATRCPVEPILGALSQQSAGRWRERALAAWVLGLISIPPELQVSTVSLLTTVLGQRGAGNWGTNAIRRSLLCGLVPGSLAGVFGLLGAEVSRNPIGLIVAVPAIVIATMVFACLFFVPVTLYSLATDSVNQNRVRAEAALAIRRQRMLGGIAALAETSNDSDPRVRSLARAALEELLPMLTPDHFGMLGSYTTPSLCNALSRAGAQDAELAVVIIDAMRTVSDSRAIPAVEAARRRWTTRPRVLEAADRALAVLCQRRENEKDSARLLRSAETPANNLLRPAGQVGVMPDLLLRANEEPVEIRQQT